VGDWEFKMVGSLWAAINYSTQEMLVAPSREELEYYIKEGQDESDWGSTNERRSKPTYH